MSKFPISISSYGVHAVLIEWPNTVSEEILDDIIQFNNFLINKHLDSKDWETISAYNSLMLICKDKKIDIKSFEKKLLIWYSDNGEAEVTKKNIWKLPVCYDLEFGIDLEEVALVLNKTVEEIILEHTSNVYTVYGIGFLPGFMYLGGLPKGLEIPRRETPRLQVERGAVGLAGKQTGVYPQKSPGGWNIIGNCPIPIFDSKKENPCLVGVGDKIQFYKVSKSEYDLRVIESEVGIYNLEKGTLYA